MSRQTLLTIVGIAATCVGLFLLYRVFQKNDIGEVIAVIGSVPASVIGLALLLTVASFTCIAMLEFLAVRYAGHQAEQRVTPGRIAATAVAAIGVGHAIGLAALSSGAIRYRMYSRVGLKLIAVGKVVAFSGISVASGYALVGGTALLWRGEFLAPLLGIDATAVHAVAIVVLGALLGYLLVCAFVRRTVTIRRHRLHLPTLKLALGQVAFSSTNLLCVAAVLYMSLLSFTSADYPSVALLYVGSDMSAVVGHVPGGWGLLEYIVTNALSDDGQVLSGIVLFRAIYYLFPLLVGLLVFVIDELRGRRQAGRADQPAGAYRA